MIVKKLGRGGEGDEGKKVN